MAEDQKGVSAIEQEITWNVSHEIKRFATNAKPGVATCSFDFANLTNYVLCTCNTHTHTTSRLGLFGSRG